MVTTYDGGSAHDGPVSKQYIYSVYWSLTTLTTVGYGDITPTNMIEAMLLPFCDAHRRDDV